MKKVILIVTALFLAACSEPELDPIDNYIGFWEMDGGYGNLTQIEKKDGNYYVYDFIEDSRYSRIESQELTREGDVLFVVNYEIGRVPFILTDNNSRMIFGDYIFNKFDDGVGMLRRMELRKRIRTQEEERGPITDYLPAGSY